MAEETHQEQPPRQHHERGTYHHHTRDNHNQSPRPAAEPRTQEPAGENLDAAENEEEHAESQHRSHGGHRGGRQPKKVYEEFLNDPYCE
ncbi:MAG: hypothetical protein WC362_06150 [Methanoregula sp.]|jgi:hypothetical protein